ncbi:MAG: DEAD/DEAH box helicase [Thermoleophilia bacterium]|jgi:ATP-dependent RNA helicase RhlE|nr:DEAD/DEAH box helicase [Actinomycetota bacterium]MDA8166592.1 DEAD/DEAH box helicase [Actinomycetota bacterium]
MTFAELGLESRLLKGVEAMGYTSPTPIQHEAIPHALSGKDVVGCAQTGTGKTAAFILPILQSMSPDGGVKALVVTPTRELALQIEEVARSCARFTNHRTAAVFGGVGYEPQKKKIRHGVDLLVATPGRLLDLQRRGDVNLGKVEILVLDEADRMLDMGFWPDVRRILALLPAKRQNLLFSATMSPKVLSVIGDTLDDPTEVRVGRTATPVEAIEQKLYPVDGMQKGELLVELMQQRNLDRVLVFTRTKHRADRVCRTLSRSGIKAAPIHSNRSQSQRQKALDDFKQGRVRVLVATDIVARGIDVDNISHVINFDMPNNPEDYVHRIGRTARAGAEGTAFSFLGPDETDELRAIEGLINKVIECEDLEGFEYRMRYVPSESRTAKKVHKLAYNGGALSGRGRRRSRGGRRR